MLISHCVFCEVCPKEIVMFSAIDDDDLDFSPAAGSKLKSVFNLERSPTKGNASLTYTAPKQPRPRSACDDALVSHGSSLSNKLSLMLVKEVHSFKLESGIYNAHGKSGAAIVGNDTARIYKLLLYKGKKQIYATALISPSFQYTVLPNLYASFYENGTQNWSIVFESKEDSLEFAKQVGVARFMTFKPGEESSLCQELYPGTGDVFKDGESAFLSLSASFLFHDASDTEKPEIKASFNQKLSNVGWTAGLVEASPDSHRLLILPENVEIPWISVKRKGPMAIEALVQNRKWGQSNASASGMGPKKYAQTSGGDSAAESGCEDSSIRARGTSIKEALTHSPRSSKASIISRMARMGQATLPLEGAVPCNPSDSEETEEESVLQESKRPPLKARPKNLRSSTLGSLQHQPSPLITSSSTPSQTLSATPSIPTTMTIVPASSSHRNASDGTVLQYLAAAEGQLVSINTPNATVSPADPSPHISMFLSEARIHNTEMRMHLSKFGDKIDQLVTKVDCLQKPGVAPASSPISTVGLEPNVLLSSIEKLVRDNQALQNDVVEKNKKLEEQNERIFSLLSTNSKFLEQSSSFFEQKQQQLMHESQQQQSDELVQQMKSEKENLESKVSSLQIQLANTQGLVQSLQKCNSDLTQELEKTLAQLQEKEKLNVSQLISNVSHQEEATSLSKALEEQTGLVSALQQQIKSDNERYLEEMKTQIESHKSVEQKYLAKISSLEDQLKEAQSSASQFSTSVHTLEVQCTELKRKLNVLSQKNNINTDTTVVAPPNFTSISEVKSLMNKLYRGLSQKFLVGQSYDGGIVKSLIASSIKEETLNFVQQVEARQSDMVEDRFVMSTKLADKAQEYHVSYATEGEKAVEQNAMDSSETNTNCSFDELDPNLKLKLESSSTSAVSSSTEPELPPIPQITSASSLSNSISASSQAHFNQEREPSPERTWAQRPPPLPLFNDDEDEDEWGP